MKNTVWYIVVLPIVLAAVIVTLVGPCDIFGERKRFVEKKAAAEADGYECGAAGLPPEACPYRHYNNPYSEPWLNGWKNGALERQKR